MMINKLEIHEKSHSIPKNKGRKGETTRSPSQQYIYSYIYINHQNPVWRPCENTVLIVKQPQQEAIVNGINQPYYTLVWDIK